MTCTNPGVTAGNDYYFRICFLDPFQGTVLANFAQEKFSAKKAYCLGELGNEYDQGLIKYFTDAFDGEVITDSFPTNTSDFSTYLSKAASSGAEVIFCPVSISYSTQIVKLAASMGLEIPILGSDTLDSNMVLEAASGSDVKAVCLHLLSGGRLSRIRRGHQGLAERGCHRHDQQRRQ